MNPEELIQLMRTCSIARVRKQLEEWKEHDPEAYNLLVQFYQLATLQNL